MLGSEWLIKTFGRFEPSERHWLIRFFHCSVLLAGATAFLSAGLAWLFDSARLWALSALSASIFIGFVISIGQIWMIVSTFSDDDFQDED